MDPCPGQTKDSKINNNCFSSKHTALRVRAKTIQPRVRIMSLSKVVCLPVLLQLNSGSACVSSTKQVSCIMHHHSLICTDPETFATEISKHSINQSINQHISVTYVNFKHFQMIFIVKKFLPTWYATQFNEFKVLHYWKSKRRCRT